MNDINYIMYDGFPTVYRRGGIAWWFIDRAWRPAPASEVAYNGAVIDKAEFNKITAQLPPFPDEMRAQLDGIEDSAAE
jgi:hypothetical protein